MTDTRLPLCPECRVGKHGNCNGQTWDAWVDDFVRCPCSCARSDRGEMP